ncbi:hypothetical protein BDQ12DRAFT_718889 [Crucibulum laeve]|uniref:Uncharacterized protein n=1 Tax=Crucibulum laeve TaxID=68775 RepID=A0A5C3ME69_9AGAR|nr:hypothetical protein BDQ12DRAFT_718889 [Crucibulum laeve]
MTSRGYRVYRHNGWFHIQYHPCNSAPEGLGLWTIAEVPKCLDRYQTWLTSLRSKLERAIEHLTKDGDVEAVYSTGKYWVSRKQPVTSQFIEWIYEIDLDYQIFHVDSRPVFRLDNLPRNEVFLRCVGTDNYGHRAFTRSTPAEHHYTWTAPTLPTSFPAHHSCHFNPRPVVSIHALLGLPESIGKCEAVRVGFYQILIGTAMRIWPMCHYIPQLENVSTRTSVPEILLALGTKIVKLALDNMVFDDPHPSWVPPKDIPRNSRIESLIQLRLDVYLHITTHLDSEENIEAAVTEITRGLPSPAAAQNPVYGIVFSFFHIVIIRIAFDSSIRTAALEFLPSFYSESPSTPGIDALIRLSTSLHPLAAARPIDRCGRHILSKGIVGKVPVETWTQIAGHLSSAVDLVNLGYVSAKSNHAANDILRYPHIAGYRLIRLLKGSVSARWINPRWASDCEWRYRPKDGLVSLYTGRFDAVLGDRDGMLLQIGPGDIPRTVLGGNKECAFTEKRLIISNQVSLLRTEDKACEWDFKFLVYQRYK